jgi:hypothetical protein
MAIMPVLLTGDAYRQYTRDRIARLRKKARAQKGLGPPIKKGLASLDPQKRSEIAAQGAKARWAKEAA